MIKQIILLLLINYIFIESFSQTDSIKDTITEKTVNNTKWINKPLPKSFISESIGMGFNYGWLGTKTVIGYKNSGFVVGLGFPQILSSEALKNERFLYYWIGIQISYKFLYTNYGTGIYGISITSRRGDIAPLTGNSWGLGTLLSFGKNKRLFFDLNGGILFDGYSKNYNLNIGIGYRIGDLSKLIKE